MSRCKHCGTEHGMAWGTGDCGCEDSFDVGDGRFGDDSDSNNERAEEWWNRYSSQPTKKVVIELEGPGLEGLRSAENMLFMANYPPCDNATSGTYTDPELLVSISWRFV